MMIIAIGKMSILWSALIIVRWLIEIQRRLNDRDSEGGFLPPRGHWGWEPGLGGRWLVYQNLIFWIVFIGSEVYWISRGGSYQKCSILFQALKYPQPAVPQSHTLYMTNMRIPLIKLWNLSLLQLDGVIHPFSYKVTEKRKECNI